MKILCIILSFVLMTFSCPEKLIPEKECIAKNGRLLPVVMYHSVLKNTCGQYIVTKEQLESDFKYIQSLGYTFVSAGEVIDFCMGKGDLPDKPIMITFDDGNYNNLCYALPVMKKYNVKAVVSVIGERAEYYSNAKDHDVPAYSTLTLKEVKTLYDEGIEIGNHTYNLHKPSSPQGMARICNESDDEYYKRLKSDVEKCQRLFQSKCQITPRVFAYPYGKITETARRVMEEEGFLMALTCTEKVNVLSFGNSSSLKNICRFNRDGTKTTYQALSFLRK